METVGSSWLLLIVSLPSRQATPRMRLWRALKARGAASLRDGVYLLPASDAADRSFAEQAECVGEAGGSAHVLTIGPMDDDRQRRYRGYFDRSENYAGLIGDIEKLRRRLTRLSETAARRAVKQLWREFGALSSVDFFPGAAHDQVAAALTTLDGQLNAHFAPDEPRAADGVVARHAIADFQGRVWATRARPWVDRLASAWLIRRFIDPTARIRWLKRAADCPRDALGFDFDGAAFTHIGQRVTFEVLVEGFGLDADAALVRVAALIHYLDVGGIPVPEADGIEVILSGARERNRDDDALLAEATNIFDSLYTAFQHTSRNGD